MKYALVWMLALSLVLGMGACARAESITGCGITVDTEDTAIDFGNVRVTDAQELVELLDQMPNLTQVDMYASSLKRTATDMLFDRYPNITFGWTFWVGDHKLRTDQTAFSTLHGRDPEPAHMSRDFEKLRYCKNLQALDIGHNWVDDLEFLRDLPQLKVLILACNDIVDITPIADLKDLEYLELFTNDITDISPLTELTKLRDLNIKNNPIKDFSVLEKMTWLERLWLGMNVTISDEQKAAIEAALPSCEIDWDNNPTEGTWRKHPHYFVIYDMFRSPDYVPFDD